MGLETLETLILEIGVGALALGMALITGGVVGVLVARRQYGAILPLSLVLAAVALLLWWEPLVRVVVSFALLLIGYTWLFAWWRASQQGSGLSLSTNTAGSQASRRLGRSAYFGEKHGVLHACGLFQRLSGGDDDAQRDGRASGNR